MDDSFRELTLSYASNHLSNNTCCDVNFLDIVKCTNEISSFSTKKASSTDEIIGKINQFISTRSYRCQGLVLLKQVVQQCSSHVFMQHAVTWSKMLLQVVGSHNTPATQRLCCAALQEILLHASKIPPLSHDLASSVIPTLVPALLAATDQWMCDAYICLASCMKTFPGPCGPFKHKIEASVVGIIGSKSPAEKPAWQCYALLAGCGGGGSQSIKHTEAWTYHSNKLMASLHVTLDELYSDLETDSYQKPVGELNLPAVERQDPNYTLKMKRRFESLVGILIQMLCQKFPAVVKLPVEDILELVCRSVALTPKTLLIRPTQERVVLATIIPFIHAAVFKLLSPLILCCGSLLLPYTDTINRAFMQTLGWSGTSPDDSPHGTNRAFHDLRVCVYSALSTWLVTLGASADVGDVAGDLIQQALTDANPTEPSQKLQTNSSLSRKVAEVPQGKRKKHGGAASWSSQQEAGQFSDQKKESTLANDALCQAALEVLLQLVMSSCALLDVAHYKSIQNFTIGLLAKISQCSSTSVPIPYSSPRCRHLLYRLLTACFLAAPASQGAPSQMAMSLLSTGTRDMDTTVSSLCREALSVGICVIHPRGPAMTAPPPAANPSEPSTSWWAQTPIKSRPSYQKETAVAESLMTEPEESEEEDQDPAMTMAESTGSESADDSSVAGMEDGRGKDVIEIDVSDVEEVDACDEVQITTVIPAGHSAQTSNNVPQAGETGRTTDKDSATTVLVDGRREQPGAGECPEETAIMGERGEKRAHDGQGEHSQPTKKTAGGGDESDAALQEMLMCFVDAKADSD